MRKKIIVFILVVSIILLVVGCERAAREIKDISSSMTGLNRTVRVYAGDGKLIKEYNGKIDIETNEYGNKVKFEVNGKRVIIYNAIVIVEEE